MLSCQCWQGWGLSLRRYLRNAWSAFSDKNTLFSTCYFIWEGKNSHSQDFRIHALYVDSLCWIKLQGTAEASLRRMECLPPLVHLALWVEIRLLTLTTYTFSSPFLLPSSSKSRTTVKVITMKLFSLYLWSLSEQRCQVQDRKYHVTVKPLIYENLRCSQTFYFPCFTSLGASFDLNFNSGAFLLLILPDTLFNTVSSIPNQIFLPFLINLEDRTNWNPRASCRHFCLSCALLLVIHLVISKANQLKQANCISATGIPNLTGSLHISWIQ